MSECRKLFLEALLSSNKEVESLPTSVKIKIIFMLIAAYDEGCATSKVDFENKVNKVYNICNSKRHEVHWLVDQLIDEIYEILE